MRIKLKLFTIAIFFIASLFAQSVTVKDYTITFDGVTVDYSNNQSTWTYTVSAVGSKKDLSHWVLELCQNHTVVDGAPSYSVPSNGDPTTGVYGIKWDQQLNTGDTRQYSFTLDGIFEITQVKAAVKTGGKIKVGIDYIDGPDCDPVDLQKASLGDKVWLDTNQNGIQDSNEDGVENVIVKLYDCSGNFLESTTTDSDGLYLFDKLDPDSYKVRFILPSEYVFTSQNIGANDSLDSDADSLSGYTECTDLEAGEDDMTWDAGIYKPIVENCVTDATIELVSNGQLCEFEPQWITLDVKVTTDPVDSKANITIESPNPYDSTDLTYTIINGTTTIQTDAYWMGVEEGSALEEVYVKMIIKDCDENIVKIDSVRVYWDENVCPYPEDDEPDIKVEKTSSTTDVENGDQIEFTLTVTNLGPGTATGVEITDDLPDGLINPTSSSSNYNTSTGVWTVGTLNEGESKSITLTATVDVELVNNSAFDFGIAGDFNLFAWKDVNQPSSDTQGKVAVGRNAELGNYSIGDQIKATNEDVLIVGKNLTYTSGRVFFGDVVYGKSSNLPITQVSIDGTLRKEKDVIDFDLAKGQLFALSDELKNKNPNGTVEYFPNYLLRMTGADPYLNVFNVDGDKLSAINTDSIKVPNGSVVVVNISGKNIDWNGGLWLDGTSSQNVIYNFYQATNIKLYSIDVLGTILAPKALLDFPVGVVNGQVFVKSVGGAGLNNRGQFNHKPFVGNINGNKDLVNVATLTNINETDPVDSNNTSSYSFTITIESIPTDTQTSDGIWNNVGNVTQGEIIWTFATDDQGRQLLGTWGGNIYRSNGSNYEKINHDMSTAYIWVLKVAEDGTVYAGTELGLFEFTGSSWNEIKNDGNSFGDVRALEIDNNGNIVVATWGQGIYRQTGSTWEEINDGYIKTAGAHALAVNANNDLFVGTMDVGIYKLANGETEWVKLDIEWEYIWTLAVADEDVLIAGTYGGGVYLSYDDGATWIDRSGGLANGFVYSIQVDGTDIFLSTWAAGVYKLELYGGSSGLGKTTASTSDIDWKSYGMNGVEISTLYYEESNNTVYAGTRNGEIYKFVPSATGTENIEKIPTDFKLHQNFPNPFNPSTTIRFELPITGKYKLQIFNILGQLVHTLADQQFEAGHHELKLNGTNLSSGVYFYRLSGPSFNMSKKMILLK